MALFVDLVALSNGLHGSVQMDSVALFSWIGWLRHHGILRNVKITVAENGTIMITFSMHSAVSFCSPSTVSHMPQPPMTLLNGFIHKLRFNRVRNRISEVTNVNKNSFRKNTLFLNLRHHVTMSLFHPLPAVIGSYAYR